MALVNFGLSGPFIRCLYYWGFTVSRKITALICPGWIVNSPIVMLVCTQSSYFLCTVVLFGDGVGSCLGGRIFATWFTMRLCPFRSMYLVLYMCTSGMLHVLPPYGLGIGGLTSVSYGMTWGYVWGGFLFERPGVIVIFVLMFTLWRGVGSGGTFVVGCCVIPIRCSGSGIFSALVSLSGGVDCYCGTAMLNMDANCFGVADFLLQGAGWYWMGLGSGVPLWGPLPRVSPNFWGKDWEFLLHWEDLRRVWDEFQWCLGYVWCNTSIVYHCWAEIPPLLAVWWPGAPVVRFVIH